MALPLQGNVTVVGTYTITWAVQRIDGKPKTQMTVSPMPRDKEEAMQLCGQIIVQSDAIIALRDQIIFRLSQENFLLLGQREQLLKEKNELNQKLVVLQTALKNLRQ